MASHDLGFYTKEKKNDEEDEEETIKSSINLDIEGVMCKT